jgi:hypothetical protein
MNNNIETFVDEYIAKKREEDKKKYSNWYLSSLGGCLSGVYYSRLNNGSEFAPQKLRVFQIGNIFEDFVAKTVKDKENKDFKVFFQERVENKAHDVSGRIDILIKEPKKYTIYELKTIHERGFFYNDLPYHHHVMQITGYKHFLFGNNENVDMKLVYISKDSFLLKEIPVPFQPSVVSQIELELKQLNEAWKAKKPPKPVPDLTFNENKQKWEVNWKARFCPYHHLCTGNENWLEEAKMKVKDLNR